MSDGYECQTCEHGVNGWGIGESEDDRDDARDVDALYSVLENEVLPTWEEGDERWAHMMRSAICTSARFTGARMISDYRRFYDAFDYV